MHNFQVKTQGHRPGAPLIACQCLLPVCLSIRPSWKITWSVSRPGPGTQSPRPGWLSLSRSGRFRIRPSSAGCPCPAWPCRYPAWPCRPGNARAFPEGRTAVSSFVPPARCAVSSTRQGLLPVLDLWILPCPHSMRSSAGFSIDCTGSMHMSPLAPRRGAAIDFRNGGAHALEWMRRTRGRRALRRP